MRQIRGLEQEHEQAPQKLLRDTRPLAQRFLDYIREPANGALILTAFGVTGFFFPACIEIFLLLNIILFLSCILKKTKLPFRMPLRSGRYDYNDPLPGSEKPYKARGICYFGNEIRTGQELWFNNDDMRTHVLIFGSTGSGKTEALVSIAYNALLQGSGFIYVDGKGDNSLFAKVFSMARRMGREDDILVVNFMTGARDIVGPQKSRISNTMNPFALGSSSMAAQLIINLMPSSSASPDGDMWKGRAISFVESLMKVLVYMRDRGDLLLDANTIRNYFALHKLETIIIDKRFPLEGDRTVSIEEAPEIVTQPLANYLDNLPGFDKNRKGKQASEVLEQHGFITMQLTRTFTSLADTYGHILRVNLPEVDFKDVVLNRRILVVLLPALEKAPEELANLGKIIVGTLKAMMAQGLGEELEGTYQQVILRKPTTALTPFMCILDEYGYYAVQGFAVVPAQARSLGFSVIFAGQDYPAFQKASKEEAASIGANTNIKICMKLEDPAETWDFFQKTAGEAYVTHTSGFQTMPSTMTNTYLDTKNASVEKRSRINLLDLKDQREGEAHFFFKSRIVRAKFFYANPKPAQYMRVNQMLRVKAPDDLTLIALNNRLNQFENVFHNPSILANIPPYLNEEVQLILNVYEANRSHNSPEACGILALQAFYQHENPPESLFEAFELDEIEKIPGTVDILTDPQPPFGIDPLHIAPFTVLNLTEIGGSLLNHHDTRRYIEQIERFFGQSRTDAHATATKLLDDLKRITHFPPSAIEPADKELILNAISALNEHYSAPPPPPEEGGGNANI